MPPFGPIVREAVASRRLYGEALVVGRTAPRVHVYAVDARREDLAGCRSALEGIDICRKELTLLRTMRGEDKKQSSMLVLMSLETGVPQTHRPLGISNQREV